MLKAVLFDLDGTLADTDPLHLLAWREALRPYGLKVDPAFYRERISGRLNPEIVRDLLGLEGEEAEGSSPPRRPASGPSPKGSGPPRGFRSFWRKSGKGGSSGAW